MGKLVNHAGEVLPHALTIAKHNVRSLRRAGQHDAGPDDHPRDDPADYPDDEPVLPPDDPNAPQTDREPSIDPPPTRPPIEMPPTPTPPRPRRAAEPML